MPREHATILYLNPVMRLGTVKVAASYEVGTTYAALLIYNEGLYALGQINREEYEVNKQRYSKKLVEAKEKPPSPQEKRQKEHLESMQRTFRAVIQEWDSPIRTATWKERWIEQAEKYKDQLPEAAALLEKIQRKVFVQ